MSSPGVLQQTQERNGFCCFLRQHRILSESARVGRHNTPDFELCLLHSSRGILGVFLNLSKLHLSLLSNRIRIELSPLSWELKNNASKALRGCNVWHTLNAQQGLAIIILGWPLIKGTGIPQRSKSAPGSEGGYSEVAEASHGSNLILNLSSSELRMSFIVFFPTGDTITFTLPNSQSH